MTRTLGGLAGSGIGPECGTRHVCQSTERLRSCVLSGTASMWRPRALGSVRQEVPMRRDPTCPHGGKTPSRPRRTSPVCAPQPSPRRRGGQDYTKPGRPGNPF